MTRTAAGVAALVAACVLLSCAPTSVQRGGVAIPYESAADADLAKARTAMEARNYKEVERALSPFLTELRSSRSADEALFLLAEAHYRQGDAERAVLTLGRLLERHPRSRLAPEAALRAAEIYRDQGRPQFGRRVLRRVAVQRAPAKLRARMHRLMADLSRSEGDYAEAVVALAYSRRDTEDAARLAEVDLELEELIQDRLNDAQLGVVASRVPRGPVYDRVLLQLARRQLERGAFSDALASLDRLPQRLRPVDERLRARLRERALAGSSTETFEIGVALPLSGPYRGFGLQVLEGVLLGFGMLTDENPPRYELSFRDTAGDVDQARAAVHELIDEGVRVIIGPLRSTTAAEAAPIADRAGIPIVTFASRPDVSELGDHVFRVGLDRAEQVRALVQCSLQRGDRRFAVLYPSDDFGTEFKNEFWAQVEQAGGEIVGSEKYSPDAVDMQPEIRKLVGLHYLTDGERARVRERDKLAKHPAKNEARLAALANLPPYVDFDALFIPDVADKVGLILPQLRFYDVRGVTYLGPRDWNDPRLVEIAGRDARGSLFVDGFYAGSQAPHVRDFVTRYQAEYGAAPTAPAARGFDASTVVRGIVEKNGYPSPSRIQDELTRLSRFEGVSGLTAFDSAGGPRMALRLLTIDGGAITERGCVN